LKTIKQILMPKLTYGIWGLGFRVQSLEYWVKHLGFRVYDLGQSLGFRVWTSAFKI